LGKDYALKNDDIRGRVLDWFANGETGVSSEAIAYKMVDIAGKLAARTHPRDPDDFKRCLKLLRRIPEIRPRLREMREVSPHWKALVDHWEKVEDSFMAEVGEWLTNEHSAKRASKTYKLMQEIYANAEKK
jgi:hypothetical protein